MSWRAIPLALRVAAILIVAMALFGLVQQQAAAFPMVLKLNLIRTAMSFAIKGLAIFGALELAGLLPGIAATGARLAAAGWALTLALSIFDVTLSLSESFAKSAEVYVRWSWYVALFCVGAGLVVAAWRKPVVAIIGGVLWLLVQYPPPVEDWFHKLFGGSYKAVFYVAQGRFTLQGVAMILLAAAAVGAVPEDFAIRTPDRVRRGFSALAISMWIRVISVSILPLLALMMIGSRGDHSEKTLPYTIVAAALVNVVSLLVFAWGALEAARARHPEVSRGPLLAAAIGALWCAGVAVRQIPELYALMTGGGGFMGDRSENLATAFSVVGPFVAAGAVVAAAIAIGGFANRRQQLDLGTRAQTVGIVFVMLTGANLAVMTWMLPEARSEGSAILILLLALGCAIASVVMFARLARDAAALVDSGGTTLPTATML